MVTVTTLRTEDNKESGNDIELKFNPPKDENTFKMSSKEKIESVDNYLKAAGFGEKERNFIIECNLIIGVIELFLLC